MWLINNRAVFSTTEFDSWVERKNLIAAEKFLIENYLSKTGRTLEAGAGAGRILFEMKALGFMSLRGFDLVYSLIERAKNKDVSNTIHFEVQDAVRLGYKDSTFDQIMYLQQVLCFIEDEASRVTALKEAFRILRPRGTALFSFLNFDARRRSILYRPYLMYLRLLRRIKHSNRGIQHLPWLRLSGKFNWHSLVDSRPYVYWYRVDEIERLLQNVGFKIVAIGSTRQIAQGLLHGSGLSLAKESLDGMLYVVAQK